MFNLIVLYFADLGTAWFIQECSLRIRT